VKDKDAAALTADLITALKGQVHFSDDTAQA
jgi:hypothetical protein